MKVAVFTLTLFTVGLAPNTVANMAPPVDFVDSTSRNYGIAPAVFRRLIFVESSGYAGVSRPDGSQGLTQIKLSTARSLGFLGTKEQLRDPRVNIQFGAMYLGKLLLEFGDIRLALDAYNRGPTRARRSPYKGDWHKHRYVRKVLYVEKPLYTTSIL